MYHQVKSSAYRVSMCVCYGFKRKRLKRFGFISEMGYVYCAVGNESNIIHVIFVCVGLI